MNAGDLLLELGRLEIRLEADGERLLFTPRSAVTPDLLAGLKAHKSALLAMVNADIRADAGQELPPIKRANNSRMTVCRCGSTTWRDVPIHGGQSVRRDCGRCRRFIDFPVWYGNDTRHKG